MVRDLVNVPNMNVLWHKDYGLNQFSTIVVKNKMEDIFFSKLINNPSYFCTAFDLNIYPAIKSRAALSNLVAPSHMWPFKCKRIKVGC